MTSRSTAAVCGCIAMTAATLLTYALPAQALSMKECSAKYKAAQAGGTLSGMTWSEFRKVQCSSDATSAAAPATAAKIPSPSRTTTGRAIFPNAVSPKYTKETPGKARMHTCLDQYKVNKAANSNGGLTWIQKGGGYYSECNKRLKG